MRRVRTFMDYLLYKDWEGKHISPKNSAYRIYDKIIYPVASNPIFGGGRLVIKRKFSNKCSENSKYDLIRGFLDEEEI